MLSRTMVTQVSHQIALFIGGLYAHEQFLISLIKSNSPGVKVMETKLGESISEIAHHGIVAVRTQEEDAAALISFQIPQAHNGAIDDLIVIRAQKFRQRPGSHAAHIAHDNRDIAQVVVDIGMDRGGKLSGE